MLRRVTRQQSITWWGSGGVLLLFAVTGLIGALGGVGGFLLPTLLGSVRQATGSFSFGFVVLASVAGIAAVSLRLLLSARGRWARVGMLP